MLGRPLCERFDLIFGTSTGAIIASLLALGRSVAEITELYADHVPPIMRLKRAGEKSRALAKLSSDVYGGAMFESVKTGIGVVATRWMQERPMIFKHSVAQAHGSKGTFTPGFGVSIGDAVQASCSAYPFFERKIVTTDLGDRVELIDGGYSANNPTLYAIADATMALKVQRSEIRVVSVGVGVYPARRRSFFSVERWQNRILSVQLLQKTLEINTQSMDTLRSILFGDVDTVRVSDTFEKPEMATDLFEHNLDKLNMLRQRGRDSFAKREAELRRCLQ
jgi:patatin-like phospholipase/acyl hydrolase